MSKLIYVAHQFGGKPENITSAIRWACWLTENLNALFYAPWTALALHGTYTEEAHLLLCREFVRKSDGAIVVGGAISPGIQFEVYSDGLPCVDTFMDVWRCPDPRCLSQTEKDLLANCYGRRK